MTVPKTRWTTVHRPDMAKEDCTNSIPIIFYVPSFVRPCHVTNGKQQSAIQKMQGLVLLVKHLYGLHTAIPTHTYIRTYVVFVVLALPPLHPSTFLDNKFLYFCTILLYNSTPKDDVVIASFF